MKYIISDNQEQEIEIGDYVQVLIGNNQDKPYRVVELLPSTIIVLVDEVEINLSSCYILNSFRKIPRG